MNDADEIRAAKQYIISHKKQFVIGAGVILAGVAVAVILILWINSNIIRIVYPPVVACERFTMNEAKQLLGTSPLQSSMTQPAQSGHTATSKCGYTDGNRDTEHMVVAAVVIRSGIDDKGVEQNKTDFAAAKTGQQAVNDLGDSAFFNPSLGQLNILQGKVWIILSYGDGSAPQENTLENAKKFAHLALT